MTRFSAGGGLVALCVVLAAGCAGPSGIRHLSEDAQLSLAADGSLAVREIWTASFAAGTSVFARDLPTDEVDGVTNVSIWLDGAPVSPAGGPVAVQHSRALRVTWRFPPAVEGATHVLALTYDATGILATEEAHASLQWPLLPPGRDYSIDRVNARLTASPGLTFIGRAGVQPDSGWTVAARPGGLEADKVAVPPTDEARLTAEFVVDPSVAVEPAWQIRDQEALTMMPAFVSAGIVIIAVTLGVLWMVRAQYPPDGAGVGQNERIAVARGLRQAGWTAVGLGAVGLLVVPGLLERYGAWPECVPAAVLVGGVLLLFGLTGMGRTDPTPRRTQGGAT